MNIQVTFLPRNRKKKKQQQNSSLKTKISVNQTFS